MTLGRMSTPQDNGKSLENSCPFLLQKLHLDFIGLLCFHSDKLSIVLPSTAYYKTFILFIFYTNNYWSVNKTLFNMVNLSSIFTVKKPYDYLNLMNLFLEMFVSTPAIEGM